MKNKILFSLLLVLMIPFSIAQEQTLGTFKINECVVLKQTCANCTYNNITSVLYPNSTIALGQVNMTKSGTEYSYTFCNNTLFGRYLVNGKGDPNSLSTIWVYDYFISPNGEDFVGDNFLIFLYLLFGALIFVLLFIFIINIAKLATASTTIYDLGISLSIYFIMLFVYWIIYNYSTASLLREQIGVFLTITAFTSVLLPLISFFVTIFVKSTQKRKPLSIEEMLGRRMLHG